MRQINLTSIIIALLVFHSSTLAQAPWRFNDEEKQYFRSAKKVRVIVEDSVTHLPFLEHMKRVLIVFGYEPVDKTARSYDATLIVPVWLHALEKVYYAPGIPYQVSLNTGVQLSGNLIFCYSNKIFNADFSARIDPPEVTEEYDFYTREDPFNLPKKGDTPKTYHVKGRLSAVPLKKISRDVRRLTISPSPMPLKEASSPGLFSVILSRFASHKGYYFLFKALTDSNKTISDAASIVIKEYHNSFKSDFLYQCLNASDARIRITAINTLMLNNDPQCVDRIVTKLKDTDQTVKKEAVLALGRLKTPKVVIPLLGLLNEQDTSISHALGTSLANFPKYSTSELNKIKPGKNKVLQSNIDSVNLYIDEAIKVINANISSYHYTQDDLVRQKNLKHISNVSDPTVIKVLIKALGDKYYPVSNFAFEEIIKHGDAAVDVLIAALQTPNQQNRQKIMSCLGKIKNPKALPVLHDCLRDTSLWIRGSAIMALGGVGDAAAIPTLESLLNDNDEKIRCTATSALGGIDDSRAFRLLIQRLRKGECDWSYLVALSECATINVDTLISLLNDKDGRIQYNAQYVIEHRRDTLLIKQIASLIDKNIVPPKALSPLNWGYLSNEAKKKYPYPYVDPIYKELGDTAAVLKLLDVDALKKLGAFATNYLKSQLETINDPPGIQMGYIKVLGSLCDLDAVETLLRLSESKNTDIRRAAHKALGELIGNVGVSRSIRDWYNNFRSYF